MLLWVTYLCPVSSRGAGGPRTPSLPRVSAVEIGTSVALWLCSYRGELYLVVCTALRKGQSSFWSFL